MILRHLRDNVVAYLALTIALGGTSYAAVAIPNGSVTNPKLAANAVTTGKIRNGAVGGIDVRNDSIAGADVKNRSLGPLDLAVGVVPRDGFVFQRMGEAADPAASPDADGLLPQVFTAPRAGAAHLRLFAARVSISCSSGSGRGGLYLDGAPLPGTRRNLPSFGNERAVEHVASVPVTAGEHTLTYGIDCPTGDTAAGVAGDHTWTVVMAAS